MQANNKAHMRRWNRQEYHGSAVIDVWPGSQIVSTTLDQHIPFPKDDEKNLIEEVES